MCKPMLPILVTILATGAATAAPAAEPTSAQKLAAAKAAGLAVKGGKAYDDCGDPIDDIQIDQPDLNGDKVPEMIVTAGSLCYGNGGSMFTVLRKTGTGWASIYSAQGTASVLKTAHGGWKDIEVDGPGIGRMPVARWFGARYQ